MRFVSIHALRSLQPPGGYYVLCHLFNFARCGDTISKRCKKIAEEEIGQTSGSFCNICFDYKGTEEMFPSTTCRHTFCKDCISKYVASKIQENVTRVNCPDTNCSEGDIGPDICREIVPMEVLERWENVLCESLISGSQKFYCPFKECSAMMLNDGEEKVTASQCPNCRRLFCAQCKVAWHAGIDCSQFKSSNKNERDYGDIMLMELAETKNGVDAQNASSMLKRLLVACTFFADADTNFATAADQHILRVMHVNYKARA